MCTPTQSPLACADAFDYLQQRVGAAKVTGDPGQPCLVHEGGSSTPVGAFGTVSDRQHLVGEVAALTEMCGVDVGYEPRPQRLPNVASGSRSRRAIDKASVA